MFLFGEDVLLAGLKNYFVKYAYKNASHHDFIAELDQVAKSKGITEIDMKSWASQWLKSTGCPIISLGNAQMELNVDKVKIKEISLVQSTENFLLQKF